MRQELLIVALAAIGFAAPPAASQTPAPEVSRDRIEVVFMPEVMFFSLEDGGQARFRTNAREDYVFTVSGEEYARVRDLLQPYRAAGLVCDDPAAAPSRDGYILWRDRRGELQRPNEGLCYSTAFNAHSANLNQAYRLMDGWARARWTPPPALPAPVAMTLVWRSWGNRLVEWTLPRGGEGRRIDRDGETTTFTVSEAQFDAFRALFSPYEGVRFECRRVITDGAYGSVIWSQPGHADQSLNFDAGCVSGDASDVFERLERAEAMLDGLREAR